jgi:hypothetical protein
MVSHGPSSNYCTYVEEVASLSNDLGTSRQRCGTFWTRRFARDVLHVGRMDQPDWEKAPLHETNDAKVQRGKHVSVIPVLYLNSLRSCTRLAKQYVSPSTQRFPMLLYSYPKHRICWQSGTVPIAVEKLAFLANEGTASAFLREWSVAVPAPSARSEGILFSRSLASGPTVFLFPSFARPPVVSFAILSLRAHQYGTLP